MTGPVEGAPRRVPRRGEAGFTLLETLMALAIVSLLLAIVVGAMKLGVSAWEKGETYASESSARKAAAAMISGDVASMRPHVEVDGQSKKMVFVGESSAIGFVTVSRPSMTGIAWGGAKWVYYSVDDRGLTVREKTVPSKDLAASDGGELFELEPGVAGVKFEYLGEGGWADSWDAEAAEALPSAVRATLSFKDAGDSFTVTMPVGLMRPGFIKPRQKAA